MPPVPRNAIAIHPPGHTYDYLNASPPVRTPENCFALYAEEGAFERLNATLCRLLDYAPKERFISAEDKTVLGGFRDLTSACWLRRAPVSGTLDD